ncbi:molybdenum cofactor synthesis domain-containing protein [Bacilli bacterium PM5-3]|nr:molybdenum cofactor synthesis domain-containing protein [Bacilli bacterium PM5-3]MDH6604323.1 molybdenum cofactor synthesis domain-containing protein [Bacilli bacterium PM5-9]
MIDDNKEKLEELINKEKKISDLIITTGGTGLTSDDISVDVVEKIMDYEIRGMSIALHNFNLQQSLNTIFSRALVAALENTMIITLPGSLKAVSEIMPYFINYLPHGLSHLENRSH